MTALAAETKTYRGASLEDVLPKIREELGPEAVITCQRDGIVGGIAGFFGRQCVEVEAYAPHPVPAAALGSRAVVDLYDSIDDAEPDFVPDELANPLVQTLVEQALPFADQLVAAEERAERVEEPRREVPEPVSVRVALLESGLPPTIAEALLREVEAHVRPFEPSEPVLALLRRSLARQIQVHQGWRGKRRTIAIVGPAGSGKTEVAAAICRAYAADARIGVAALSLEPARRAVALGSLTEGLDIDLAIAESPGEVRPALGKLTERELVVADTPAVVPGDPKSLGRLAELLNALRPDETHLLVPGKLDEHATGELYECVAEQARVHRLAVTRLDEAEHPIGPAVGLALGAKKAISYVTRAAGAGIELRPADPVALAALVLP